MNLIRSMNVFSGSTLPRISCSGTFYAPKVRYLAVYPSIGIPSDIYTCGCSFRVTQG